RIAALPPHAHIAGFAADDLSHLLAELMENATSFSPPDLPVEVSGWLLENGEVMLSVQDEGIGMAADRLERLNERLSAFDPEAPYEQEGEDGLGLGLYVVARLAQRHGLRVKLREQKQGGIAAVVVVPQPLLADPSPTAVPASGPVAGGAQSYALAGADAEANSNVLHGRTESDDPLVDLAEQAVRRQQPAAEEPAVEEPGAEGPGAQGVDAPDAEESVAQGADARDAEESVAQGTDEHDADVRGASGSAAVGAGRAADRTAAGAAETGDDAAPRLDADEADADATGADAPGADEAEADAPGADEAEADAPGADEAEADATGADEADADAPDARTPEPAERDASEAVDHGAAEDDTDGRDTDAQAPAAERAAGHDAHARPDAGAPERAEQRPGGDHATDATADSGDTDGVDDTGEERDDAPA